MSFSPRNLPYNKFEDPTWWQTLPPTPQSSGGFDLEELLSDELNDANDEEPDVDLECCEDLSWYTEGSCSDSASSSISSSTTDSQRSAYEGLDLMLNPLTDAKPITTYRKRPRTTSLVSSNDGPNVYVKRARQTPIIQAQPTILSSKDIIFRKYKDDSIQYRSHPVRICVSQQGPSVVATVLACDVCSIFVRQSNSSRMIGTFAVETEKIMVSFCSARGIVKANALTRTGLRKLLELRQVQKNKHYDEFLRWFNKRCLPVMAKLEKSCIVTNVS